MNKLLNVSSSPHARSNVLTQNLMFDVAIAMIPASVYGVYQFGLKALCILLVTVAGCVLSEYVYERLMGKPITIMDGSALVTGMILALNMPPEIPLWIPLLGGIFAIIVVKQLYGGLGQNFMNPALAARCFLLISFANQMSGSAFKLDGVSTATPLSVMKNGGAVDVAAMFVGKIPGTIGEVSVVALLIGEAHDFILYRTAYRSRVSPGQESDLYPDPCSISDYLCSVCVRVRRSYTGLCAGSSVRRRPDLWRLLHGDGLCDKPHYS